MLDPESLAAGKEQQIEFRAGPLVDKRSKGPPAMKRGQGRNLYERFGGGLRRPSKDFTRFPRFFLRSRPLPESAWGAPLPEKKAIRSSIPGRNTKQPEPGKKGSQSTGGEEAAIRTESGRALGRHWKCAGKREELSMRWYSWHPEINRLKMRIISSYKGSGTG